MIDQAELEAVKKQAQEFIRMPPGHRIYLPRERPEPMTPERFTRLHGPSVQVSGNRRMHLDGAWTTHDSILGTVFHEPSTIPVELLLDKIAFWKVRLKQADSAYHHFRNERYRMFNSGGQLLTVGPVQWNQSELSRPAPLDASGHFDLTAALEWLAFLVRIRTNKLKKLETELRQLRPNLISV